MKRQIKRGRRQARKNLMRKARGKPNKSKGVKSVGSIRQKAGLVTLTYHPPSKQMSPVPDRMFTSVWATGQYTGNIGALQTNFFDVLANSITAPFNATGAGQKTVQAAGNFVTAVTSSSAVVSNHPYGRSLLGNMYESYTVLGSQLTVRFHLAGGYTTGTSSFDNLQYFGICIYPYVVTSDQVTDFHAATKHPRSVTKYFKSIGTNNSITIRCSESEIQGWDELAFINDVSGTHDTLFAFQPAALTSYRVIWQSMNGVPIGINDGIELELKQKVMLTLPAKNII